MFLNRDFYNHNCFLTCEHYGGNIDYSAFKALCPNAERACREAVWFEHRLLLAEREDMDDIARAISKIYECRDEFNASSATASK